MLALFTAEMKRRINDYFPSLGAGPVGLGEGGLLGLIERALEDGGAAAGIGVDFASWPGAFGPTPTTLQASLDTMVTGVAGMSADLDAVRAVVEAPFGTPKLATVTIANGDTSVDVNPATDFGVAAGEFSGTAKVLVSFKGAKGAAATHDWAVAAGVLTISVNADPTQDIDLDIIVLDPDYTPTP